jgi:tetratricopeptide (TPR) repeat protein
VKKLQLIAVIASIGLVAVIFYFGKTSAPGNKNAQPAQLVSSEINIDTILNHAKKKLKPEQATWLAALEQSVIRGDVRSQQLDVYHQLAHFWKDSVRAFEPYAWYEAEAARLEYSEKTLTFAAHLFLENLKGEENPQLKKWKALQAKDLFERSLKINDKNDSSLVGLGACYIFGGITENPMEGILKVRQVVEKDSSDVFAQMVLGQGSVLSGQYDKAIDRFEKVISLQPDNLEALVMLAEVYERKADKPSAIKWYSKAVSLVQNPDLQRALQKRIEDLSASGQTPLEK